MWYFIFIIAVFVVLLIVYKVKSKRSVNKPADGATPLSRSDVENLTGKDGREITIVSSQGDQRAFIKPVGSTEDDASVQITPLADKSPEKPKPEPRTAEVPFPLLRGVPLWNWWVGATGSWGLEKTVIEMAAQKLNREQAAELCQIYAADHPALYKGICQRKDWYEVSDVYAKVIGLRIEALLKCSGMLKRK